MADQHAKEAAWTNGITEEGCKIYDNMYLKWLGVARLVGRALECFPSSKEHGVLERIKKAHTEVPIPPDKRHIAVYDGGRWRCTVCMKAGSRK